MRRMSSERILKHGEGRNHYFRKQRGVTIEAENAGPGELTCRGAKNARQVSRRLVRGCRLSLGQAARLRIGGDGNILMSFGVDFYDVP
jgi:hypothetical protein